jgi:putative N-acetylmannosamine-6-phosphate epimerase
MKGGLIVSIQGYSFQVSLELASMVLNNGAVGIRTDIDINIILKAAFPYCSVIALKKLKDEKYYITASKEAIDSCMWGDYIAIDSRRGNPKLEYLYGICYYAKKNIVSDIRTVKDVENILKLVEKNMIKKPAYIATTFAFDKKLSEKIDDIEDIKNMTDIPIIAEGGIKLEHVPELSKRVHNICIGKEITGIGLKTGEFVNAFNRTT